jgi:hypothetical protein
MSIYLSLCLKGTRHRRRFLTRRVHASLFLVAISNATSNGVEELVLEIPNPGTLVMELNEQVGVGDFQTYALWGVQDPGATFKFESGTTDVGLVLLHDAVVDAFTTL